MWPLNFAVVKGLKRTGEARWPIAHGSSGASAQPRHTTLRLDGIWPAHRLLPMGRPRMHDHLGAALIRGFVRRNL